jgi:hypothetical protein
LSKKTPIFPFFGENIFLFPGVGSELDLIYFLIFFTTLPLSHSGSPGENIF